MASGREDGFQHISIAFPVHCVSCGAVHVGGTATPSTAMIATFTAPVREEL